MAYAATFPDDTALLIDTYDTVAGARRAAQVGQYLQQQGRQLRGVRLDSGDLLTLSQETRAILDAAGLTATRIYASGGLNEEKVARLVAAGAPIDLFGVGTDMGVSGDAPSLDMAYKLVEYAGKPRLKLSTKKVSLLGKKQVFRVTDENGCYERDIIAMRDERPEEVAPTVSPQRLLPLLTQVMAGGKRLQVQPSLRESRQRFLAEFAKFPEACKQLQTPERYPVTLSPALSRFQEQTSARLRARYGAGN
jgi:nicotinate phosphoribosyltransferase